jgi:5-methylcytosine-specific restriction endonuclease McrA
VIPRRSPRKMKILRKLLLLQQGRCIYCAVEMRLELRANQQPFLDTATIDHIFPRTDIRRRDPAANRALPTNKVAACFECNNGRNDRPFEEFYRSKARLREKRMAPA